MTTDMGVFELALLEVGAELDGVDRVEAWLHDPARTAHRLVSVPTAALVEEALGGQTAAPSSGPVLPGGAWRVLPDRLLALRPHRRTAVTVAEHLHLTATVLEQWGWAQSGGRIRTTTGRRCILGAQAVVHRLGYGDQAAGFEAGRQIQGTLTRRGISMPYPQWNELPTTTGLQALGLVREAAAGVM